MASSSPPSSELPSSELYCPIRQLWVQELPEELVRQKLLTFLIERLHFPKSSIAVEVALNRIPHLAGKARAQVPDRRADIVCFAKGIHQEYDLYPLVLIECKAVPITQLVVQQVVGYNRHVKACFIAVANAEEVRLGWWDPEKKDYTFIPYIPNFDQLLRSCGEWTIL